MIRTKPTIESCDIYEFFIKRANGNKKIEDIGMRLGVSEDGYTGSLSIDCLEDTIHWDKKEYEETGNSELALKIEIYEELVKTLLSELEELNLSKYENIMVEE